MYCKTKLGASPSFVLHFLISYITAGSGENVLLLHGANIGWGQWYPNIAELAQYFKVYALDLPGSGASTKINFRTSHLENDFLKTVDEFIKVQRIHHVHIIGHSFGGWIALKLALKEKKYINKIVLVNSLGFSDYLPLKNRLLSIYIIAKIFSYTIMSPSKKNMQKFLKGVLHNVSALKNEFIDYFYENVKEPSTAHPFLFINRISGLFKMKKELLLINELAKIHTPVLIVTGNKDPLLPLVKNYENFKLIPNAQIEIFLDTGHVPSIEESRKFNDLVIKFLKAS